MISWNEFKLNAEKRTSVADRLAFVDHEERMIEKSTLPKNCL